MDREIEIEIERGERERERERERESERERDVIVFVHSLCSLVVVVYDHLSVCLSVCLSLSLSLSLSHTHTHTLPRPFSLPAFSFCPFVFPRTQSIRFSQYLPVCLFLYFLSFVCLYLSPLPTPFLLFSASFSLLLPFFVYDLTVSFQSYTTVHSISCFPHSDKQTRTNLHPQQTNTIQRKTVTDSSSIIIILISL